MGRAHWALVVSLPGIMVACGGAAFTAPSVDGGGDDGTTGSSGGASGSGGASSGGTSSSSGGGSGGTTSSGASSSGTGSSTGGASSGGSGGSGSSGASSSGGSGGSSSGGCMGGVCDAGSPCPPQLPPSGGACAQAGLACEYGGNPVLGCDYVATCTSFAWAIQSPPPATSGCSTSPGPSCPSSFSAVQQGYHCGSLYGTVCDYPQGRCECTVSGGAVPLDASSVATWQCQNPGSGCPVPRAPLGSACSSPGLSCDYGGCFIQGGSAQTCTNGVWKQSFVACPL